MGRDITEDELNLVVNQIREKIQEEGDVREDKFINVQYMNDMILLQNFISKKVEEQKIRNYDEDTNVNINDFKEFPTLGANGNNRKKKRGKNRTKKEPPAPINSPPPTNQKNIIEEFEQNYERKKQKDDQKAKKMGLVGGMVIGSEGKKMNNFDILKSSNGWETFEKNFFVKGSVKKYK